MDQLATGEMDTVKMNIYNVPIQHLPTDTSGSIKFDCNSILN